VPAFSTGFTMRAETSNSSIDSVLSRRAYRYKKNPYVRIIHLIYCSPNWRKRAFHERIL
jgi:hypothetical protein